MIRLFNLSRYFLVASLFLTFLMGNTEKSVAQVPNGPTVLNQLTQTRVPVSAANINLKFKLVAWDALTKQAISADTKQIDFALIITNDSPYTFGSVNIGQALYINVTNLPGPNKSDSLLYKGTGLGSIYFGPGPFSSTYIYIPRAENLILKNVSTKSGIVMNVGLTVNLILEDGNTISLNTYADDVVYMPSNSDLIPVILNSIEDRHPFPKH